MIEGPEYVVINGEGRIEMEPTRYSHIGDSIVELERTFTVSGLKEII